MAFPTVPVEGIVAPDRAIAAVAITDLHNLMYAAPAPHIVATSINHSYSPRNRHSPTGFIGGIANVRTVVFETRSQITHYTSEYVCARDTAYVVSPLFCPIHPHGLHMKRSSRLTLLAVSALTIVASQPAYAAVSCPLLNGIGVTVRECPVGNFTGTYDVINNSGQTIFAFGVSTLYGNASTALGAPSGWTKAYYTEASWNSTLGPSLGLGIFDNTFNRFDTGLFYFTSAVGITTGTTLGGFTYATTPSSDFIAIGANNVLISSSLPASTNTVPEPSSYAMLGAGLLGLAMVSRRKGRGGMFNLQNSATPRA